MLNNRKKLNSKRASTVAFTGLLFALALVFTFLENMLPAMPFLPPGVKLGLSNIVTMYALFFLGTKYGYTIAILKAFFTLLTRGQVGALLSLSGGLVSVTVMFLLIKFIPKPGLGYMILSIIGAVSHNFGQLIAARYVIGSSYVFYYLPIMVISGVVMGVATGYVLRTILPALSRLGNSLNKNL